MQVLFADDDPLTRALLSAVLTRMEHEPVPASEANEAWERYEALRPTLVILDVEMPGTDGVELCRRIRTLDTKRETFILVLTGRDTPEDLAAVLDAGADDYMTKPPTPETLIARLTIAESRIQQATARRAAEAELQKARWLAGIGETTITLQHEINNPLSALLGHAELLFLESRDRGADVEQLQIILTQARRIADVVRRLGQLRDPQSVEYAAGARMIDLDGKGRQ